MTAGRRGKPRAEVLQADTARRSQRRRAAFQLPSLILRGGWQERRDIIEGLKIWRNRVDNYSVTDPVGAQ